MNHIRSLPHMNRDVAENWQVAGHQENSATTPGPSSPLPTCESAPLTHDGGDSAGSGVTFSVQSINLLDKSEAGDSVVASRHENRRSSNPDADDAPSDLIWTLGAARQLVAGTVAEGLHVAADALVGGIDVVADGLQLAVRDIEGALEKSTSELAARAEAAVGYAAVAAMASAAALNELA